MSYVQFNELQQDMLKEVINLSMGKAGKDLAILLNSFVDLVVPGVKVVAAEKVVNTVIEESVFTEQESIIAIKQHFFNSADIDGDAVVIFNRETCQSFSGLLGLEEKMDAVQEKDFVLELSNMLVGACINSMSSQLFKQDMSFQQPNILAENMTLQSMAYDTFKRRNLKYDYTLLAKITFNLKEKSFKSDLLVFISEKAIEKIHGAIVGLLEELK